MKRIFLILLILSAGVLSSACAKSSVVNKTVSVRDGREVTTYTAEGSSCKVVFKAVNNRGLGKKYLAKEKENCGPEVGYDIRLRLYEKVISEVSKSGFWRGDREVAVAWGGLYESAPLRCKLIRYASNSKEWEKLVAKYGNKPVKFYEATPNEFSSFIDHSGILDDVVASFMANGFELSGVGVRSFRSVPFDRLKAIEKNCVSDESGLSIFPYDAQIYMSFIRKS